MIGQLSLYFKKHANQYKKTEMALESRPVERLIFSKSRAGVCWNGFLQFKRSNKSAFSQQHRKTPLERWFDDRGNDGLSFLGGYGVLREVKAMTVVSLYDRVGWH